MPLPESGRSGTGTEGLGKRLFLGDWENILKPFTWHVPKGQ